MTSRKYFAFRAPIQNTFAARQSTMSFLANAAKLDFVAGRADYI